VDGAAELECNCGMETGHALFCATPHIRATLEASCDANCPATHTTGKHEDDPDKILKVPSAQTEHVVPSSPENPALHVQFVKTLLACAEFDATGHVMHTSEGAPNVPEYFPGKQDTHTSENAPDKVRYFPDTQLIHTSDGAATELEYFPAMQLMHTLDEAPTTVEYFPARQPTQTSEFAATAIEYLPAIQRMQTSELAPSTVEYFPAMQFEQTSVVAPTAVEYFPATHFVHSLGPGKGLKDPAAQSKHTDGVVASIAYAPVLHSHIAAPAALCEFTGHDRQTASGVFGESALFKENDANAKSLSDKCLFHMYTLESCHSLVSEAKTLIPSAHLPLPPVANDERKPFMIVPSELAFSRLRPHVTTQLVLGAIVYRRKPNTISLPL